MSPQSVRSPDKLVYKRPVEVVEDATPARVGRVTLALALAALAMLVLGSNALLEWANNLPIGPISDFLLYVTQAWQNLMTSIGVTHYASAIRAFLHRLQDWR